MIVKLPYVAYWEKRIIIFFLVLKMKIYVIYIFKIYSGYKCFKIIQICTNLKYVFLFWQDQNSSRTSVDLADAAHARGSRAELSVALLTLV